MNTTEFSALDKLREILPVERWKAFLMFVQYLMGHPEMRIGQALVNIGLQGSQSSCPELFYLRDAELLRRALEFGPFVIRYLDNGSFNQGCGYEVGIQEATRYRSLEAAQEAAKEVSGPLEIVRESHILYGEYLDKPDS